MYSSITYASHRGYILVVHKELGTFSGTKHADYLMWPAPSAPADCVYDAAVVVVAVVVALFLDPHPFLGKNGQTGEKKYTASRHVDVASRRL